MLSLVTVFPVITAIHSCCLSHHVFDQVNLWPAWVGFETAIFWQCSPGTVETQRLYSLCHGPRRSKLDLTWLRLRSLISKWFQLKTLMILFNINLLFAYSFMYWYFTLIILLIIRCPVSSGYRIHRLHLCRKERPPPNEYPAYDTKQSDDEVRAMLEIWGNRNTP